MRDVIGYRWEDIIDGLDARSKLNVHWQRMLGQASFDGFFISTFPLPRELLVFEGDAELIQAVRKAAETVTKSVRASEETKA